MRSIQNAALTFAVILGGSAIYSHLTGSPVVHSHGDHGPHVHGPEGTPIAADHVHEPAGDVVVSLTAAEVSLLLGIALIAFLIAAVLSVRRGRA